MSVINQMLRDLEERKASDEVNKHYIDNVNIVSQQNPTRFALLVLGLLLVVSAIIWFILSETINQSPHDEPIVINEYPLDLPERKVKSKLSNPPTTKLQIVNQEISKPVELNTATISDEPQVENKVVEEVEQQKSIQSSEQPAFQQQVTQAKTERSVIDAQTRNDPVENKLNKKLIVEESVKSPVIKQEKQHTELIEKTETSPSKKTVEVQKFKQQEKIVKTQRKQTAQKVMQQARNLMLVDKQDAIALLEEHLTQVETNVDYFSLLANLYQRQQQFAKAIIYYKKALVLTANKGELWIGIALAYRGKGQEKSAISAFKKAISLKSITPELRKYAQQQVDK